tara:strand:+ start:559 stop:960 length:402 start_codon:yes stop_codon:yes gene_type:complete
MYRYLNIFIPKFYLVLARKFHKSHLSLNLSSIYREIINVPVIRLDKLIDELNIDKIKLLKIEAEGYDPEVLEGLGDKMRICQYIAVDGGYERVVKSEQTLKIISKHLLNNGFEMMDIYFPWCRALFVNKKQNF